MGEKRHAELAAAAPDYGDAYYADLLTTQLAFNQAASSRYAPGIEAQNESDTDSLDHNRAFRTKAPSAPKFS
jgi:hypothetical protein